MNNENCGSQLSIKIITTLHFPGFVLKIHLALLFHFQYRVHLFLVLFHSLSKIISYVFTLFLSDPLILSFSYLFTHLFLCFPFLLLLVFPLFIHKFGTRGILSTPTLLSSTSFYQSYISIFFSLFANLSPANLARFFFCLSCWQVMLSFSKTSIFKSVS